MFDGNLTLLLAGAATFLAAAIAAGARRPILFFYGAVMATAILKTPELPLVREKFALTEVFMILTWIFWSRIPRVRRALPSHKIVFPLGYAFIVSCMASAIFGLSLLESHSGDMTRTYAGVFVETVNYAYGIMIVFTAVQVIDRWERLTGAVFAWLLGMGIASFVGTLGMLNLAPAWAYEEGTRRISSTLRNENQVPSVILPLITVPIVVAAYRKLRLFPRTVMLVLTGTAFFAAIGAGSRTGILMLVLAAIMLFLMVATDRRARPLFDLVQLRSLSVVFMLSVAGYFVVAWAAYDGEYSLMRTPSWQRPAAMLIEAVQGERELDQTRPRQIRAALEHFFETPVFGTGPKLGAISADTHGEVHNTYFSLLLETGFVGLVLHLALLWQAGMYGLRGIRRCPYHWYRMLGRGLVIGLLLLILYNNTILGLRQRNIWFLIGLLFAFSNLVALKVPPPRALRVPKILRLWRPFFVDPTLPPRRRRVPVAIDRVAPVAVQQVS